MNSGPPEVQVVPAPLVTPSCESNYKPGDKSTVSSGQVLPPTSASL